MGIADKYNVGTERFNFNIPEEFEFINLKELYEENGRDMGYVIMAFFINTKGKYGDNPVIATDKHLVNIPSHMTDSMKDMRKDDEVIQEINKAKVGFKIYEYSNDYGLNYSIQFIDL